MCPYEVPNSSFRLITSISLYINYIMHTTHYVSWKMPCIETAFSYILHDIALLSQLLSTIFLYIQA